MASKVTNVLRRVTPTDGQPDQVDSSGVALVWNRQPHWTNAPPSRAGWWAVRFIKNRTRREFVYVNEAKEFSPDLEFSDRAYSWPLEPSEEETDGTSRTEHWVRHSPLVQYIDDIDYSEHSPTYWVSLGIIIGISIGILMLYGMFWLLGNH